jgi:hypothetical protein
VDLVCWLRIGVSDGEAVDVAENVCIYALFSDKAGSRLICWVTYARYQAELQITNSTIIIFILKLSTIEYSDNNHQVSNR